MGSKTNKSSKKSNPRPENGSHSNMSRHSLYRRSSRSLRSLDSSACGTSEFSCSDPSLNVCDYDNTKVNVTSKTIKAEHKKRSRILIPQKTIVEDNAQLLNPTPKHMAKFSQRFDPALPDKLIGVISEEQFRHTITSANRKLESLLSVRAKRSTKIFCKAICPLTLGLSMLLLETRQSQRLEDQLKKISSFFKGQNKQPVYSEKNITWVYHYKDASGGPYGVGYIEIKFYEPESAPKSAPRILKTNDDSTKGKASSG
eukprot:Nk52_evm3s449 gene=Nk52_evmTU3s449